MRFRCLQTATVIVVFLLTGCANQAVGPDVAFDSRAKDSLVLMGAKVNRWYVWDFIFSWWKIDPNTGSFDAGADAATVGWVSLDPSDRTETRHFLFRVPPGRYALESLKIHSGTFGTTIFHRPNTIAFDVAAGEIAYIGEFKITVPSDGYFFPSLRNTTVTFDRWDDDAARRALAGYPGVRGAHKFVKPVPIRLK